MTSAARELAFEYLREPRIAVLCEGRGEPSADEWDSYLELLRRQPSLDGLRVFVYSAGGRPSRAQQQELMELTSGHDVRVAVVAESMALRFVVSVFALINRQIDMFAPSQLERALAHIRCTDDEAAAVRGALERLRLELEAGPGSMRRSSRARAGRDPESHA